MISEPKLVRDGRGLFLTDGTMTVRGDFARMIPRIRQGVLQREMLVKAARLKGVEAPTAIDATAGLGEDSLLLAAAGFRVRMFERNPTIAALLVDALERAASIPEVAEAASRMELVTEDSIEALPHLTEHPDLVLLDPMFPAKHGDARAKKKLQLLQKLEQPCEDETALLEAAFAADPRKIVVKRPLKGPHLADRKPSYSLRGKTIRYDCYVR
jgi:16S rRNA (guanine1516-N2)-methyltransferase